MQSFRRGHTAAAVTAFDAAVRHDPTTADAWLGLHAVGERQQEALDFMGRHAEMFGTLRTRHRMPLSSRFSLGEHVTFRLENRRDLWLAQHAALLDNGLPHEAWASLGQAYLDCDETRFLCTRCAYLRQEWRGVLSLSGGIEDAFLRDEAHMYTGVALVHLEIFHEALRTLAPLPQRLESGGHFEAEVAYWRGRAHQGLGSNEEALKHFQYAFRCWPGLYDVAELARATRPEPVTVTPPTPHSDVVAAPQAPEPPDPSSPNDEDRTAALTEALAELDGMIGLEPVKRQIRTMVAQLRMAALREQQGLPTSTRPQHFVFAGPPGTGKTTVARIVGRFFSGLGLLARGHVVEAQRADLVGQHLGSTALKTSTVIDSAMDGVLFIDEAYSLSNDGYHGGDAFGDEALQVLLKRAEDDRDRLVVILAGYWQEMASLLAVNPGLTSRFTTLVEFPSYTPDELGRIARVLLSQSGDVLSADAEDVLTRSLHTVADRIDVLGNGRFVRNLCQKAAAQRDLRLEEALVAGVTPTRGELVTVREPDLTSAFRELTGSLDTTAGR
ncbi:ATPase AAA [Streptomyces xiamenensis]|uniref:ATPase AAA n=1 Tax=Streptomyces xiamenensis TaxID=408015 RepID=A0A0F7FWL6_9ACTN|nr:AAA family ATPase [Streptomyces xiamenensis]AKG44735.1 ATPase AAA [Streptomyces xiamenensis]